MRSEALRGTRSHDPRVRGSRHPDRRARPSRRHSIRPRASGAARRIDPDGSREKRRPCRGRGRAVRGCAERRPAGGSPGQEPEHAERRHGSSQRPSGACPRRGGSVDRERGLSHRGRPRGSHQRGRRGGTDSHPLPSLDTALASRIESACSRTSRNVASSPPDESTWSVVIDGGRVRVQVSACRVNSARSSSSFLSIRVSGAQTGRRRDPAWKHGAERSDQAGRDVEPVPLRVDDDPTSLARRRSARSDPQPRERDLAEDEIRPVIGEQQERSDSAEGGSRVRVLVSGADRPTRHPGRGRMPGRQWLAACFLNGPFRSSGRAAASVDFPAPSGPTIRIVNPAGCPIRCTYRPTASDAVFRILAGDPNRLPNRRTFTIPTTHRSGRTPCIAAGSSISESGCPVSSSRVRRNSSGSRRASRPMRSHSSGRKFCFRTRSPPGRPP